MVKRTSKKKKTFKKAAIVAGAVAIVAGSVVVTKRYVDPREKVLYVIDGDSFKIGRGQTIRLSSLDAPYVEFCFGKEAKDALTKKIDGKKVILKEPQTDVFGRILALVYVNGKSVNEYMIKNGYAKHIWDMASANKELDRGNDFARKNKLGIFSEKCFRREPPKEGCDIKGNIMQKTKNKEYTMPECDRYGNSIVEGYRGEEWFCSEKEARKAGYVKSKNCK